MKELAGFFLAIFLFSCGSSGSVLWQLRLQGRSYADPIVDGDKAFIASSAGEIFCISTNDGSIFWQKRLDSAIVASPAISQSSLFAGTQDGSVVSLSKSSGNQLWRRKFGDEERFESSLSLFGNKIIAPSTEGNVYALSPDDGSTVWVHHSGGQFSAPAAISGGHIYIGGWSGFLFSIRSDGKEEWRFKTDARIVDSALVLRNSVFVPTHGRFLYALDAPSGRLLWRFNTKYPTSVVPFKDSIVFGSGQAIFQLRMLDGSLLRNTSIKETIINLKPASTGCLIVTSRVLKLDLQTGRVGAIAGMPAGMKPFKIAESENCYIITDDLYSVLGIKK